MQLHNVATQLQYSPLRSHGAGLTDGEGTERLWSYLRRYSKMTKEMRPSHRIDVLSHALAHYGWKKKEKLGTQVMHDSYTMHNELYIF